MHKSLKIHKYTCDGCHVAGVSDVPEARELQGFPIKVCHFSLFLIWSASNSCSLVRRDQFHTLDSMQTLILGELANSDAVGR